MRPGTLTASGLVGLLGFVLFAAPVSAATVYFGEDLGLGETSRLASSPNADAARNGFEAGFGGLDVESFEGFAAGTYAWTKDTGTGKWNPGRDLSFDGAVGTGGGGINATLYAATGTVIDVATGTNGYGRYPTDGNKLFHTQANPVEIVFDREVAAFGFDGIDVGDFAGQLTVTTYNGADVLKTFTIAHAINGKGGDVLFWGIVDLLDPFTKVVFGNTGGGTDTFGIDRLMAASAAQVVPVPAALPLLASGLAGLAWMRRRRR